MAISNPFFAPKVDTDDFQVKHKYAKNDRKILFYIKCSLWSTLHWYIYMAILPIPKRLSYGESHLKADGFRNSLDLENIVIIFIAALIGFTLCPLVGDSDQRK